MLFLEWLFFQLIGNSYQLPADASGKALLHEENAADGHKHTASCFGFGQGGGFPGAPPAGNKMNC